MSESSPGHRSEVAVIGLGFLIYFLVNIHRATVPGQIFSQLQGELGVSASAIAALSTVFMYSYAVVQLLAGIFADRYGGIRIFILGGVVMCLGALLFALATNYWALLASRALVGAGCGGVYISLVKECNRLFPLRYTTVVGFMILFGYLGGVAGTYPFVRAVQAYGWRNATLMVVAAGVAVLLLVALRWRTVVRLPTNPRVPLSIKPYLWGFSNFNTLKGLFSVQVTFGAYYLALTIFGKKFLEDVGGFSGNGAALCCSVMVLCPAFCNQITGGLSGRLGNRRRPFMLVHTAILPVAALLVMLSMLFLPPGVLLRVLLVAAILMMSLSSGFSPTTTAYMMEVNPPERSGVALGISNFTAFAFIAVFGTLAGAVLDLFAGSATADASGALHYPNSAYLVLFAAIFTYGLGAHLVARTLQETNGRNIYRGRVLAFKVMGRRIRFTV